MGICVYLANINVDTVKTTVKRLGKDRIEIASTTFVHLFCTSQVRNIP